MNSHAFIESLTKEIFLEMLRSYNNGVGVTHGANPLEDVARNLTRESYTMALEYQRTLTKLQRSS